MSDVHVKEPNTAGKVVIHTSHGDLDIELWSKECPKACRNFVQLCMEGYYNNLVFHRIIPNFMIQGGCKAGTGDTCESIYDAPYPIERHGRLQFRHRGMVGVANAGKGTDTNGSQFFITLARADFLNNSHTLFGKITGTTAYNLMRLGEMEVDKADRPIEPPVIRRTEVIWNPFDDIVPRCLPATDMPKKTEKVRKPVEAIKNKTVLSFDNESDEDGEAPKLGLVKSAHDALGGRFLSQPAYDPDSIGPPVVKKSEREEVCDEHSPLSHASSSSGSRAPARVERAAQRQKEIAQLQADILDVARGGDGKKKEKEVKKVSELRARNEQYAQLRRGKKGERLKDGAAKKNAGAVIDSLSGFSKRLREIRREPQRNEEDGKDDIDKGKDVPKEKPEEGTFAEIIDGYEDDDDDLGDWCSGGLKFHVSADKAYHLDQARAKHTLETFDPMKARAVDPESVKASRRRMRDVIDDSKAKKAKGGQDRGRRN